MTSQDYARAIAEATAAGDTVRLATLAMELLARAAAAEQLEARERERRAADAERKRQSRGGEPRPRRARKSQDVRGNPVTSLDVRGNPGVSVDVQGPPPGPPSPPLPAPIPSTPPFNPPAPPEKHPEAEAVESREGERAAPLAETARALDGDHPELAGLPEHAVRLVTLFYAASKPSRRKDAIDQLRDTLDPARPGAQLDRNTWVRAANPAQLDLACRKVLQKPPRNLEMGAKFALLILTDLQAAQAREATEGAAARNRAAEQHEAAWRKARGRAILAWERDHPGKAEALRLEARARLELPGDVAEKSWAQQMVQQYYATLAQAAIGFPDADAWRDPTPRRAGPQAIGEVMLNT